jgi:secreted PhoX family phosphatase
MLPRVNSVPRPGRRSEHFSDVLSRRYSRRDFLKAGLASSLVIYLPDVAPRIHAKPLKGRGRLSFEAVAETTDDAIHVARGHTARILLKWGDPVLAGAPPFDPAHQTAAAQSRQFGYNADFIGFMPLPRGSTRSDHGLLVVNHEYTNPELMFAGYDPDLVSKAQVDVQLAAHGLSIVEVTCGDDGWRVIDGSPYARRVSPLTPMLITGPAAGHPLMRTQADPAGQRVVGTIANCSAGRTPWGTILSGEENFHVYFGNRDDVRDELALTTHARYGVPRQRSSYGFESHYARFDLAHEPHEPFRFGWVVEIDPYDPEWTPRKRTALGRLRREGAACVPSRDGRLVLYSGDDIPFEYVYKFVTREAFTPGDRDANADLLDDGVLYVARFHADGTGEWLPLVQGLGPLTASNGFYTQGDVVIRVLQAADRWRATRMDRPEDIKIHPSSGKVYMTMTHNLLRGAEGQLGTDASNPRVGNKHGHVIEVQEDWGDHASTRFTWNLFLLCGDPDEPGTRYGGYPMDRVSRLSCPDNLTFDPHGHLWIATDGQPRTLAMNDALYAVPVEGSERGYVRRFFTGVPGAEICGPEFTPDGTTLFVAIQHPGEGSTLDAPTSLWPDGGPVPRPSVVAIQASSGGWVGSAREGGSA